MDTLPQTLVKYFVYALIGNIETLATKEFGVRLINAYFDKCLLKKGSDSTAQTYMNDLCFAILKHAHTLIPHRFGWFIFYHLLRCHAPVLITDAIKENLKGKYHKYCKSEFASKIVEQCIEHSRKLSEINKNESQDWATVIVGEILFKCEDLVSDKYGKHVFHLALLTKVSPSLTALKDSANRVYVKHVKSVRQTPSFYEFGDDIGSEDEQEIYTENFKMDQNEILEYMEYPVFS